MSILKPIAGYRPSLAEAKNVPSPPYDVLNTAEAIELAKGNPSSFLHVIRPEIDLPEGTDLHADEVYAKGAENLNNMIRTGVLVKDDTPSLYIYRQVMGEHSQVGIVGGASVDEYNNDLIKKHELTRQDKEDDRTRHVDTMNANAGPVFLTYKADNVIDSLVADVIKNQQPDADFIAEDGIAHTLWRIDGEVVTKLTEQFKQVSALYVADGHHRSASAARVGLKRQEQYPNASTDAPWNYFLAVCFPDNQLNCIDYNRVVLDLNNLSKSKFLEKVSEKFNCQETSSPKPSQCTEFGMYLDGQWYKLQAKEGTFPAQDPVESLDVSILQNNLLNPILGIEDPRTSKRIDFVGGIRGLTELEKRVANDAEVAFALYPTTIEQLMAIADAGKIMPPKSTWFEPKLRSGMVVYKLED